MRSLIEPTEHTLQCQQTLPRLWTPAAGVVETAQATPTLSSALARPAVISFSTSVAADSLPHEHALCYLAECSNSGCVEDQALEGAKHTCKAARLSGAQCARVGLEAAVAAGSFDGNFRQNYEYQSTDFIQVHSLHVLL